mmetsp:Transcript_13907/g.44016  ORF Transcript_13907/g.44016 Transcript_13907/m.44016 type:complete len:221 (+) Transcript_13907:64-726(+)
MLTSSSPDVFHLKQYMDRFANRRRATSALISRNDKIMTGIDLRPASAHLEPGCYKIDRDVVLDSRREVKKGVLTDSSSSPCFSWSGSDDRSSPEVVSRPPSRPSTHSGARGRREEPQAASPAVDPQAAIDRAAVHSAPSWSMSRGDLGARQQLPVHGPGPAPGSYEAPSRFDNISRSRQRAFDRLVRRTKTCRWEQEFGTIFRNMHASATQTRHTKPVGF